MKQPKSASRPRTKPADVRRDDLLTAAEKIFLEKGVEPTTIEKLTRGAGISKGAFYLHFASKGEVIEALRARFIETVLERIKTGTRAHQSADWRSRLAAWSRSCAAAHLEASHVHAMIFAAATSPNPQGMVRNLLIEDLTSLLVGGAAAAAWELRSPRLTAIFLFNGLHGVVASEQGHQLVLEEVERLFLSVVGLG
ncbi:TetR/AcrR family transcriptional regulator [Oryzifoliimicrobium ureilyticus]|uniref:TetR/AcrR family transcriptional regulator n=1 Tax=Oryzifoliimicrobium ureilyticus TaxID=3113724 RepID=UPI003076673E